MCRNDISHHIHADFANNSTIYTESLKLMNLECCNFKAIEFNKDFVIFQKEGNYKILSFPRKELIKIYSFFGIIIPP